MAKSKRSQEQLVAEPKKRKTKSRRVSKDSAGSQDSLLNDNIVHSKCVDFSLIAETFEQKTKQDNSFSELKIDNESKGKGRVPAISTKRIKMTDKPPLHDKTVSTKDRASSAYGGSILKRATSFSGD